MRVRHEVLIHVSQDQDQQQTHFLRKETLSRITIDSFEKHASGDFKVLDTQSDTLSLGDIDAVKGIYLEAAADCDVYLNGSGDPIQLRKAPGVAGGAAASYAKLFLECDITSVQVTASQGSDVSGVYVVWGDVVP